MVHVGIRGLVGVVGIGTAREWEWVLGMEGSSLTLVMGTVVGSGLRTALLVVAAIVGVWSSGGLSQVVALLSGCSGCGGLRLLWLRWGGVSRVVRVMLLLHLL